MTWDRPAGSDTNQSRTADGRVRRVGRRATLRHCTAAASVTLIVIACSGQIPAQSNVKEPAGSTRIQVEPAEIHLDGANRQQQILVTAVRSDSTPYDVTRDCVTSIADPEIAVVADSTVRWIADGVTTLRVRYGAAESNVTVTVRRSSGTLPIHFANDIVPILSKLGCNSGGCHGKASGQNGFKLSVFGFDPAADLDAIVKEARGRRVFPSSPERSLFLLKPTAQVPHGGGKRLDVGSSDYQVLLEWLRQGMLTGRDDAAQLSAIELSPLERVMQPESGQQILVTAIYSDGSRRDVTGAASYATNSDLIAEVDPTGLVHSGHIPGEAAITVRYMGQVAAFQLQLPRAGAPEHYPELSVTNQIDEFVWAKLKKLGVVPSELADDATFLRRLFIDTIGTLPTPAEAQEFLDDTAEDKRSRMIDTALNRREFADLWALRWADILLVDRNKLGDRGAYEFHRWLRKQFASNRPYDQWVRELITASGDTARTGPLNFYRALRSTEEVTRSVSQAFLGVRLECAQCHHHPYERWSQSDFYGLAGFFNGLQRKPVQTERPNTPTDPGGPELIFHGGLGETRIPYSNLAVATQPLGGWTVQTASSVRTPPGHEIRESAVRDLTRGDPREALADWMTDCDNPYFARLVANRLWKHFLGRGLVEPEDDLRSTNPATNPALLDYLAEYLVQQNYDLKELMRFILSSRVYQLSSVPTESNKDDYQNFSHYTVKRLPAEVLLDAISDVTGVAECYPGKPPGTRAISLWDNRMPSYFLEIFGRPERNSPCECGRSSEPTMAQALHLMNAPEVAEKIEDPSGRVARLLSASSSESAIVNELCLAALGRPPREKERAVARRLFQDQPAPRAAEDFLWSLLNSYEFLFVQ